MLGVMPLTEPFSTTKTEEIGSILATFDLTLGYHRLVEGVKIVK